ncbi:MAG: hypothetical protein GC168_00350 [Candidatus Hydrogenedens sp.]|nr:hypothetical protein [Candidatus Hydrogenedens sp.]
MSRPREDEPARDPDMEAKVEALLRGEPIPPGTFKRHRSVPDSWAFGWLHDMVEEDPESTWPIILEILRRDIDSKVIETLSAGPVEDLLGMHGVDFIARVEVEARRDPRFAKLLGGVWQGQMSDEHYARVQAVWDRRGWDGIPRD